MFLMGVRISTLKQLVYHQSTFETCLNCISALIRGVFSQIHTIVLHNPQLAESAGTELWILRASCKVTHQFSTCSRVNCTRYLKISKYTAYNKSQVSHYWRKKS